MNNNQIHPPGLARYILSLMIEDKNDISAQCDLEDEYKDIYYNKGRLLACLWFWIQVLYMIPAKFKRLLFVEATMLKNYLKIALRNLRKYKVYSMINITGLAIAISCSLLILIYVQYEFSYDTYHENAGRIFKIIGKWENRNTSVVPCPLAPALIKEFPEVESATRFFNYGNVLVQRGNKKFIERRWFWTDENIFEIFTLPLIHGEKRRVLKEPFSVVIDESTAEKYFGRMNPIGKTIKYGGSYDFQITGVMKNIPKHSHFKTGFISTLGALKAMGRDTDTWGNYAYHTYIMLKKASNSESLEKKMPVLIKKYQGTRTSIRYGLQPLRDIHLKSPNTSFPAEPVGDIKHIYIFCLSAFLIIMVACVNYMNLSTARSITRMREVGIRKVVGAHRGNLVRQFFGESLLLTLLAISIALCLTYLLINSFASIVDKEININQAGKGGLLVTVLITGLFVGLFSGWYPALYLSKFRPSGILRGIATQNNKGFLVRNILVVTQFVISIFLIISTFIISRQVNHIRNKNLGFERDHILFVGLHGDGQNIAPLKKEIKQCPGVINVALSNRPPMKMNWGMSTDYEGLHPGELGISTKYGRVDYDFLGLYGIELVAGRNFSRQFASDKSEGGAYILNETAVKRIGWEKPIGKKFRLGYIKTRGTVVGVVKDFHNLELKRFIEPLVLHLYPPEKLYCMSIRIHSGNPSGILKEIETTWKKFNNGDPFNYYFVDEAYDNMYKAEIKLSTLFKYFSLLAIVLSCLGLLGLASFYIENSRREICIRKVLGATVTDVVRLLSWKFCRWIIIANFIAFPLAYWVMRDWLRTFAYRASIDWWIFVTGGSLALVIALLTVSYQSIKAANLNPVEAMKHE